MSRHTADVVVIGAGILGAAAAHYLSRAGQRVVVFDRGAPNREGSGTTAGNLHIQAIHPSRPGQEVPADNGRFLPLQVAVSDMWESVELKLETSVELRRHGGFMIAETPHEYAELRAKQAMEAAAGLPTELLDGDAARAGAAPAVPDRRGRHLVRAGRVRQPVEDHPGLPGLGPAARCADPRLHAGHGHRRHPVEAGG